MTVSDDYLHSLALQAGDDAKEEWGLSLFYFYCCQVLIEVGLALIDKDRLAEFVFVAFQRRQDRFPSKPLLNDAGVYAASWENAR
tara:strand:- start:635 stop:889 length:255 start_codon:yes stop_codon:yes gene_type:complete